MKRLVGMHLCHVCGKYIEREADEGKPLKKWRKSYCQKNRKKSQNLAQAATQHAAQAQPQRTTNTMKRTKKELAERKAKAAEIAAMYATVANGGRMERRCTINSEWLASNGPTLHNDLDEFRAIPAPKKKP